MKCPYCGKPGSKKLKGFCCRAHRRLKNKPPPKVVACAGCGSPQRRSPSSVKGLVFCKRCKRPKGENHYRFKEGSYIDRAGYRHILVNGVYHREHRMVWEAFNKASLLPNGTIHHIRFDLPDNKTYNEPDNLVLVSDTEHGSFHRLYDVERYEEAFRILEIAGRRQLHWPVEIDKLRESIFST